MIKALPLIGLLFVLIISGGCGPKEEVNDPEKIKTAITEFYKWYNVNWQTISSFKLYTGKGEDNAPPYHIDWEEAEKYFTYLRKNVSYLGEDFITTERQHFQYADSMFKVEPGEEIAIGFDYDRYTQSQEDPQWLLDLITQPGKTFWDIKLHQTKANVVIYEDDGDKLKTREAQIICLDMTKVNGVWKIAKIGCPFTADEL